MNVIPVLYKQNKPKHPWYTLKDQLKIFKHIFNIEDLNFHYSLIIELTRHYIVDLLQD